jgi:hypothetical protein
MDFAHADVTLALVERLESFMAECVHPAEETFFRQRAEARDPWAPAPVLEELKAQARARGLWNLFLPRTHEYGAGLTNVQYAPLAEITGRALWLAPEAINCSAPDTGNMELLSLFGTAEQRRRWRSASGSVTPMTISSSQRGDIAPDVHHLRPLMTYSSPSRSIRVAMLVASEDATSGSVIENAERTVPSSIGSSQRSCCSGVPNSESSSMLPVSGAEQLIASGAIHGLRPVISANGAYCRLVRPAPCSCVRGRKRFQSPRRRASALSSSMTGGVDHGSAASATSRPKRPSEGYTQSSMKVASRRCSSVVVSSNAKSIVCVSPSRGRG